jgi:hypothetical protein
MRLSDQDSLKDVAQDSSKDAMRDSAKDVSQDSSTDAMRNSVNSERKAKSKTTNAKTGHFNNFFMC